MYELSFEKGIYVYYLGPDFKLVTAWIALSDSNIENGCVKFIR